MLSIFNPYREKLNTYRGYDIRQIKQYFRSIILLKNRYGDGDISIGCNYFGNCNVWRELPRSEEITDYEKYTHLEDTKVEDTKVENFNITM